jgi:hypothetical protein
MSPASGSLQGVRSPCCSAHERQAGTGSSPTSSMTHRTTSAVQPQKMHRRIEYPPQSARSSWPPSIRIQKRPEEVLWTRFRRLAWLPIQDIGTSPEHRWEETASSPESGDSWATVSVSRSVRWALPHCHRACPPSPLQVDRRGRCACSTATLWDDCPRGVILREEWRHRPAAPAAMPVRRASPRSETSHVAACRTSRRGVQRSVAAARCGPAASPRRVALRSASPRSRATTTDADDDAAYVDMCVAGAVVSIGLRPARDTQSCQQRSRPPATLFRGPPLLTCPYEPT